MDITEHSDTSDLPTPATGRGKYMFLLGLTVYCVVIWYLGWRDIRDKILAAHPGLAAIAITLILSATWMRVAKWRYALGSGFHATGLYFLSKATGNVTPGRLGEFAPMVLRNHRTPKVGAWIMFDRVVEILVTIALGLYGLAVIELLTRAQFIAVLATAVAGSTFGVYLLTHRRMFLWLSERLKPDRLPHKVVMLLAAVSEELFMFLRSLPLVLLITVVTKAMDLLAVMLIFQALEARPGFGLVAAAKCALAIVSFLPLTPTATGVPHGTQAWLMNHVADIPAETLVAGIGIEVVIVSVTFWTSFGLASRLIRRAALPDKTSSL